MIRSLEVYGYRAFAEFRMGGLGRINLLVGRNNSGKTTALEAINILEGQGAKGVLWEIAARRGEFLPPQPSEQGPLPEVDIAHLFSGHRLNPYPLPSFSVRSDGERGPLSATCRLTAMGSQEPLVYDYDYADVPMGLSLTWEPSGYTVVFPLTRREGVTIESRSQRGLRRRESDTVPVQFVTADSLTSRDAGVLWENIALTEREEPVLNALRTLEPSIERIAFVGARDYGSDRARGGFVLRCHGSEDRVPIGSMGDGVWRLLSLVLAAIRSENGVLLVDEIDTGLHYSSLVQMWKLILSLANGLDVQVFATTHSYDCVQSLAEICQKDVTKDGNVSIQRIERDVPEAVPFSEREIVLAAERQIELR